MEKLIDTILNDVSDGNYEAAVSNCNLLIAEFPLNPVAYELRGDCYFKMKKAEHAALNYTEAIELTKPKTKNEQNQLSLLYNKRGLCFLSTGKFSEALTDFKMSVKYNPENYEAYNNRAKTYRKKENYQEAIKDCSKAISLNPNFAEAYNNRGNVYYLMSNAQGAINDYTLAIKINPNYAGAYYNRGSAFYFLAGNTKDALTDWVRAVELNENYKDELLPKILELKKALENPETTSEIPPAEETGRIVIADPLPDTESEKFEEQISTPEKDFKPFSTSFTYQTTPLPSVETENSSINDLFLEGKVDVSGVTIPSANDYKNTQSFNDVFESSMPADSEKQIDYTNVSSGTFIQEQFSESEKSVLPDNLIQLHNEITGSSTNESEDIRQEDTSEENKDTFVPDPPQDNIAPADYYTELKSQYDTEYTNKPKHGVTIGIIIGAAVILLVVVIGTYFLLSDGNFLSGFFGKKPVQYDVVKINAEDDTTKVKDSIQTTKDTLTKDAQLNKVVDTTLKTEEKTEKQEEKTEDTKKEQKQSVEKEKQPQEQNTEIEISPDLKSLLVSKNLIVIRTEDGKYWLQAGSFKDRKVAESLRDRLYKKDKSAQVTEGELPGKGVFYRVRIGAFNSIKELEQRARKLEV